MTPTPLERFRKRTNPTPARMLIALFAAATLLAASGLDALLTRLPVDTWLPGGNLVLGTLAAGLGAWFFARAWRETDDEDELLAARVWIELNDQVAVFETSAGGAGLYLVQGSGSSPDSPLFFVVGARLRDAERRADRLRYLVNTARGEAHFTSLAEQSAADFAVPLGEVPLNQARLYVEKLDGNAAFIIDTD